ncbi:efflux RND transporter periplasmic adaptor subunit [Pseudogulbenkiania sp. MAI-1]|uniref:efflux RND transporter periplasmic adaptor subunit n=1 Tax=Pseudogulbenkiania sp. MAI-1 TaxID=990370 RepID=UPI00045EAF49|nr:efflux RND transporter periplasmic adaptor subunit [Pseudogulbenkiania sp. MAI-1]
MNTATPLRESFCEYPRLRHDLRISEQNTREGTVYVIGTPEGGRFFRFGESEYFIARQLDGATSPEEIRHRAEARFGSELPAEVLEKFLSQARSIGLLEGEQPGDNGPAPARRRVRGDPLYLRLKAIDPDRQLEWLLPKFRFCFTRGFVVCSVLVGLLASAILVGNAADVREEFARLDHFHALAYAWFVLLATMAGHEYAHGLACKHFGGQVREMGFMLIYFQPAVYCNVNDAWLFAEKSKRLWVAAAGPYLDMLLWAIATVVWRVTDPDSWVHFTALVVMLTTVARTLLNLNPLIKLDAYYFLADLVEIHNLRFRAFRYLGGLWRRLWGASAPTDTPTARERRIFIAYGVLAGIYSVLLLGYVAAWFGQYLVERYRGLGFLIFMGLLIMIFRHPLKQSLHVLPERLRSGLAGSDSTKRRTRIAVLALLALIAVLPVPMMVSGNFAVLPTQNADIRPDVDGVIEAIYVKEGDRVGKGALIARLSNRDRQAALDQLDAAILERQAKLKMLRLGARSEDIALLRQRLATASTRELETKRLYAEEVQLHAARLAAAQAGASKAAEQLKFAEEKFVQMKPLEGSGAISPLELKEAESDAVIRRKTLEEAQATLQYVRSQNLEERRKDMALAAAGRQEAERELQRLQAGSRPEEIEAAEAEVASLEARRANLRDQIQRAEIRAPHAGVITTPRLEEMVGQHVFKGGLIAKVHDLHKVTAEISVPELDIADVRVGQPVRLKARAFAGETFEGTVTGISPATAASDRPSGSKVVRVRTVIDNAGGLLKSDMTGVAKIEADDRPLIAVLGHDLISTLRVEFWSWW